MSPALLADGEVSYEELRQQGERFYQLRQFGKAIEVFERAAGLSEGEERIYVRGLLARSRSALGMELFSGGETRQAEKMFLSALEASPDPYANFGLGYLAFVRFDDPGAREQLQHALVLEDEKVLIYKMLALLDYRKGRSESALQLIENALKLDRDDAEAQALSRRWKKQASYAPQMEKSARRRMIVYTHRRLSHAARNQALRRVERARAEVEAGLSHSSNHRIVVVLYPESVFSEMTGTEHWVGGTYDGQIKLPVSEAAKLSAQALAHLEADLRHEMTHAVMSEVAPECPVWLNEGIAQHFQHRLADSGEHSRLRQELRARLIAGADRRISLNELPARLAELSDEPLVRWSYLQAHGFVDFLVSRHQEFRLRLLLDHLQAEGSLSRAFRLTYGRSLPALEEEWWRDMLLAVDARANSSSPASQAERRKSR